MQFFFREKEYDEVWNLPFIPVQGDDNFLKKGLQITPFLFGLKLIVWSIALQPCVKFIGQNWLSSVNQLILPK